MESFKNAFLTKYPQYGIIPAYFEEATGVGCAWDAMTKVNLQHFVDWLRSKGLARNTVKFYCSLVRSLQVPVGGGRLQKGSYHIGSI